MKIEESLSFWIMAGKFVLFLIGYKCYTITSPSGRHELYLSRDRCVLLRRISEPSLGNPGFREKALQPYLKWRSMGFKDGITYFYLRTPTLCCIQTKGWKKGPGIWEEPLPSRESCECTWWGKAQEFVEDLYKGVAWVHAIKIVLKVLFGSPSSHMSRQ